MWNAISAPFVLTLHVLHGDRETPAIGERTVERGMLERLANAPCAFVRLGTEVIDQPRRPVMGRREQLDGDV
jgi:hypothetical protein